MPPLALATLLLVTAVASSTSPEEDFLLNRFVGSGSDSRSSSLPESAANLASSAGFLQAQPDGEQAAPRVDYFLSNMSTSSGSAALSSGVPSWISGTEHFRLIPATWYTEMDSYHFDGLAAVIKFTFGADGTLSWFSEPFHSPAYDDFDHCLFFGNGVTKLGRNLCFLNPAVNLLPIEGQLWLTIDTSSWGRVDPDTLSTMPNVVEINSLVLNAHPACDRATGDCYVQHPCPASKSPWTDEACFSVLRTSEEDGDLHAVELGRTTLSRNRLIQHTHSPCVTPGFVVSKIDAFEVRDDIFEGNRGGLLKFLHQGEIGEWLLFNRATNETSLLTSPNHSFVNNHFWNCYEDDGAIVVETVATTSDYLDTYFADKLADAMEWDKAFAAPLRCRVPTTAGASTVGCAPLSTEFAASAPFDYPTYNPHFKMTDYKFFYAIQSSSSSANWFDTLIKVDVKDSSGGKTVASWSAPEIYLTEADFVPRTESKEPGAEDDGVLLSVLHNATSGISSLAVFDAATLVLLDRVALGGMVPFHAHGIVCKQNEACFSNP